MTTPKTAPKPRKRVRTTPPTSSPAPSLPEPFDWFGVAALIYAYQRTGEARDVRVLADALADAPPPPPGVLHGLGEAFYARLLLQGRPGRRKSVVAECAGLRADIAAEYRRQLRVCQAAPASDHTARERAADLVCLVERFKCLALTRDAVYQAARATREKPTRISRIEK